MGWWKDEGTENVLGDDALDVLHHAVSTVVTSYESKINRRPTRTEWEALLASVFGNTSACVLSEGPAEGVILKMR